MRLGRKHTSWVGLPHDGGQHGSEEVYEMVLDATGTPAEGSEIGGGYRRKNPLHSTIPASLWAGFYPLPTVVQGEIAE